MHEWVCVYTCVSVSVSVCERVCVSGCESGSRSAYVCVIIFMCMSGYEPISEYMSVSVSV